MHCKGVPEVEDDDAFEESSHDEELRDDGSYRCVLANPVAGAVDALACCT